jgi:hypothetical protein
MKLLLPFRISAMATAIALFVPSLCRANSEMRDWTLAAGGTLRAEIENVDESAGTVTLRKEDKSEVKLKTDDFATLDRAWLLEWIETAEELEAEVTKLGGRIEHFQGRGATTVTDFYVYHPSGAVAPDKPRAMMILFDPSGKGRRYLLRHMEAADAAKMILITTDVFRNNMDGIDRFRELFPIIGETVAHDPARVFLGGTSGGASKAFHFSAHVSQYPWAGVYSNGGWLGGKEFWGLPFPSKMKVAMVNGDKDKAANQWLDGDTKALQGRGITVAVMAFEGAHQIPPASVQTKAFKWLLGDLE